MLDRLRASCTAFELGDYAEYTRVMSSVQLSVQTDPQLYGEWLLVSALSQLRDPKAMLVSYRQATKLLKGRSQVFKENSELFLDWYNPVAIVNVKAGRASENAVLVDALEELHTRFTGGGQGAATLYRGLLSYYQEELESAKTLLQQARQQAQRHGQTMTAICAAHNLAELSKHTQDMPCWSAAKRYIHDAATAAVPMGRARHEQAEVCETVLSISMGVLSDIPKWIKEGDFGAVPVQGGYRIIGDKICPSVLPNAMLTYIQYLLYSGQPDRALVSAGVLSELYGQRNIITDAYLDMLRAGCYRLMNWHEQADAAAREAVLRIAKDGLWLIAAEFLPAHGDAILSATKTCDGDAYQKVMKLGEAFWDKLAALRNQEKQPQLGALSRRELTAARLAAQALSNAQIASQMGVTESTVKYHLFNAFGKLGVERRGQLAQALSRLAAQDSVAIWIKPDQK